jgi:DNA-binding transcriptional LysR family regulator
MRYDLTDLQLFVNIVEAGTITAGAKATFLTAASASERIKGMEDALGRALMVRGRKGVTLTEAGTAVLRHARTILQQMRRMQGDLEDIGGRTPAHVRLLCNTSAVSEHLPPLIAGFLRAHRSIAIDLEERSSPEIADAIRDEVCDLGVLSDAADVAGLECRPFRRDPLVLVFPSVHALARRKSASLDDLTDIDLVGLSEESALQRLITTQLRRAGKRVAYRVRVPSLESVCAMVDQGIGVGIVPAAVAQRARRSMAIRAVGLAESWAQRSLLLCMRKRAELPAHTEKLMAYLQREAAAWFGPGPASRMILESKTS